MSRGSVLITTIFLLLLFPSIFANSLVIESMDGGRSTIGFESGVFNSETPAVITESFFEDNSDDTVRISEGYYGTSFSFIITLDESLVVPPFEVGGTWHFQNAWPTKTSGYSPKSADNSFTLEEIINLEDFENRGEGILQLDHLNVTDGTGVTTTINSSTYEFPKLLLMNSSRKGSINPGITYNSKLQSNEPLKINLNSSLYFGSDLYIPQVFYNAEIRNSTDIVVAKLYDQSVNTSNRTSNYTWDTKIIDEGDYLLNYSVSDDLGRTWNFTTPIIITEVENPTDPKLQSSSSLHPSTTESTESTSKASIPLLISPFLLGVFVVGLIKRKEEVMLLNN
ncbi:MAG: hypothetical protein ACW99A_20320 [Candidatus Kariarchaeaceae archaeon]|jgi:hypothetical protein